jgi:hypothetical protein
MANSLPPGTERHASHSLVKVWCRRKFAKVAAVDERRGLDPASQSALRDAKLS